MVPVRASVPAMLVVDVLLWFVGSGWSSVLHSSRLWLWLAVLALLVVQLA